MIIYHGDMWNRCCFGNNTIPIATTNSYISLHGEVVMGRGAAKEAKERFPWFPRVLAQMISSGTKQGHLGKYGFILCFEKIGAAITIGAFQVKRHFRSKAEPDLIVTSTEMLAYYAQAHPAIAFIMNFPGIGFGGLSEKDVMPLISHLPDNVIVCKK